MTLRMVKGLKFRGLGGPSLGRSGMEPQVSDGGHMGFSCPSSALKKAASNSQIPSGKSRNSLYRHPSRPCVPPLHLALSLSWPAGVRVTLFWALEGAGIR